MSPPYSNPYRMHPYPSQSSTAARHQSYHVVSYLALPMSESPALGRKGVWQSHRINGANPPRRDKRRWRHYMMCWSRLQNTAVRTSSIHPPERQKEACVYPPPVSSPRVFSRRPLLHYTLHYAYTITAFHTTIPLFRPSHTHLRAQRLV